jgi:RHS repeat-associated protein
MNKSFDCQDSSPSMWFFINQRVSRIFVLCRYFILGLTFFNAGICSRADTVVLKTSWNSITSITNDSITYTITVHSSPNALQGAYTLNYFGSRLFNVGTKGVITLSTYAGGTAILSKDKLSVSFPAIVYSDNLLDYATPGQPTMNPPGGINHYYDFQLYSPDPNNSLSNVLIWDHPETISCYLYADYFEYFYGTYYGFASGRPASNLTKNIDLFVPPANSKTPPPDNRPPGPCPSCGTTCSPHMTTYSLDRLRATLRLQDTPVSYNPPVGPAVSFTITYNQADLGELQSPLFANLGPNWTYSWLSYINGDPDVDPNSITRYAPGGGLEYYPNYLPGAPYHGPDGNGSYTFFGTFAPERDSRAVLNWDPQHRRYTRLLPDGSFEIYDRVVTDSSGMLHFLLTQSTDAQGNSVMLIYDNSGRLISVQDAIGQVTTLNYGLASDPMKITRVTDPFGRSATFTYDSQGRFQSSTDPLKLVSSYGYSGSSTFIDSLTTPYGTTTFAADSDGDHQGINAKNPLGQTERAELRYDSVGISDSESQVPTATGHLINNSGLSSGNSFYWSRREYADGAGDYTKAQVFHWMKGDHGLTAVAESTKMPLEGRVWYTYSGQTVPSLLPEEASNEVVVTARVLDGGATQASFATYSPTGLITQSVDPVGRTTNYSYDPTNNVDLLQVTQANGAGQDVLSTMTYNGQHLPLTMTDASGQTTTMTYNGQGQMLTRTDAKSETTTLAYTDNYLTSVTGPVSGATTTYSYDSVGRVHTVTDSEGYTVTTAYDNFDRPTVTTYPDGTTDQTFYKNLDVAEQIDRQGRTTTNQYDPIRELLQTTDPLGRTTKYTWCTCGGLSTLTDANGNVTTWGLDMQGRVTGKTYADGSQTTYVYESNEGRLHRMTDAMGNNAVYSYNLDNTLGGTAYTPASGVATTPNVSFTYDPVYNRVTGMTDGTGTTGYSYNAITGSVTTGAGRLAGVSVPIAGSTATIAYGYDQLGRVTSRSVDGSTTNENNVSTTFDSLGRVTNVSNTLGAFTYAYVDQTSRLSGVTYPTGTGLSTAYAYLGNVGDQRLQEIKNLSGSNVLSQFDYTYNPVGTIATWQQQTDSNTPTQYALGYDAADQLISAVQSNTSTSATVSSNAYNYDPAGNRLAETTLTGSTAGQFNNVNQLTSIGGSTSQTVAGSTSAAVSNVTVNAVPASVSNQTNFTANVSLPAGTNTVSVVAQPTTGAVTTKRYQIVSTGTAGSSLTYDANGNTLTDENGNSYQWDALNRLTKITYPSGASSLFAYDGLSRRIQIVEENASGTLTSTKNDLWIGQEIVEERDASGAVTKRFFPQGEQQVGTDYYYTRDHINSVREVVDGSGNIQARYNYDAYGRATLVSGTNLATFQYTGDYAHQASGLELTQYRAYDPNTGRWLSRDPLKNVETAEGPNVYSYVRNEPTNLYDPSGLKLVDTGVKSCFYPIHFYIRIDGQAYGFHPADGGLNRIYGPGAMADEDALFPDDTKHEVCRTIWLDDCQYDIAKFKSCMKQKADAATANPPNYSFCTNNCAQWVGSALSQCEKAAKKK